jgi:hypothetical protein
MFVLTNILLRPLGILKCFTSSLKRFTGLQIYAEQNIISHEYLLIELYV